MVFIVRWLVMIFTVPVASMKMFSWWWTRNEATETSNWSL